MPPKVLDKHIRKELHKYIKNSLWPTPTLVPGGTSPTVVDELAINRSDGRLDVVVLDDFMHGFEIKSEADKLDRLPRQVKVYGRVFDYMSVVTMQKYVTAVRKLIPAWWGIYEYFIEPNGRDAGFHEHRSPKESQVVEVKYLVECLWRPEALQLLIKHGLDKGMHTKPKYALHKALFSSFTKAQIHEAVLEQFKQHRRKH